VHELGDSSHNFYPPSNQLGDDEMKRPECFDDRNVVKHPCKGTENIGGPHHDGYGQCIHHWDCRTARMKAWDERRVLHEPSESVTKDEE